MTQIPQTEIFVADFSDTFLIGRKTGSPIIILDRESGHFDEDLLSRDMSHWSGHTLRKALYTYPEFLKWFSENWNNIDASIQTKCILQDTV